jgi:plastocyanin
VSALRLAATAGLCTLLTGPAVAGPVKTYTITIEAMQFHPRELTVHRGEHIVWVNQDLFPHTVTAANAFDSGGIAANASWTYVAAGSGEFAYHCTFHPTMTGKITVQ